MSRVCVTPFHAQRCAKEVEGLLALARRHLEKADALPHVEALVHPLAPFRIVHGKERSVSLDPGESGEKRLCRLADQSRGDPGRAESKQTRFRLSVGGDSLERLGQTRCLGRKRQSQELGGGTPRRWHLR